MARSPGGLATSSGAPGEHHSSSVTGPPPEREPLRWRAVRSTAGEGERLVHGGGRHRGRGGARATGGAWSASRRSLSKQRAPRPPEPVQRRARQVDGAAAPSRLADSPAERHDRGAAGEDQLPAAGEDEPEVHHQSRVRGHGCALHRRRRGQASARKQLGQPQAFAPETAAKLDAACRPSMARLGQARAVASGWGRNARPPGPWWRCRRRPAARRRALSRHWRPAHDHMRTRASSAGLKSVGPGAGGSSGAVAPGPARRQQGRKALARPSRRWAFRNARIVPGVGTEGARAGLPVTKSPVRCTAAHVLSPVPCG